MDRRGETIMKKKLQLVSITALVFVIVGFLASLWLTKRSQRQDALPTLASNEKKKIDVDVEKKRVRVIERRKDGTTKVRTTEGVERLVVTQTKEDELDLWTLNKGLSFRAGMGVGYARDLRVYSDVQIAWWGRYGVIVGASYGRDFGLRGHGGLSYALPFEWTSNTHVFVAIDTKGDFNLGLRVRL